MVTFIIYGETYINIFTKNIYAQLITLKYGTTTQKSTFSFKCDVRKIIVLNVEEKNERGTEFPKESKIMLTKNIH